MKKILLVQILLLCGLVGFAQKTATTYTVSGEVSDDMGPLPGVSVYLQDRAGVGTTTKEDGSFTIKASKGDIIVFSYMGFKQQTHLVTKDEKGLKITMVEDAEQLEEVVVTGVTAQKKVSVVGAVTNVDVSQLQAPGTSMTNMLGGRVAGVITMQASGEPGKNISDFWIRGIGTFGANASALVLIDGLEGDLSQVDPADVESFSILKDASATAIYGVRGANGVVIITTKRGTADRLRIQVRANLTVSELNKLPDYLGSYDYALLANEAAVNSGQQPIYSDMELDLIKYNLDPDLYPNVDWQKELLHKASLQQTYYISAQGGGTIARYFVSLGMSNESAAYKQDSNSKYKANSGYNTYNYRSNLDINVTPTTTAYVGLQGYITETNKPGIENTDQLWTAQRKLTPLTIPLKYSTGELPAYGPNNEYSPYVMLNYTGMGKSTSLNNLVSVALTQDLKALTKGLTVKVQGSVDSKNYYSENRYVRPAMYYATGRGTDGKLKLVRRLDAEATSFKKSEHQWRQYELQVTANYSRVFGQDHRVGAVLYYRMSDSKDSDQNGTMASIPYRYQGLSGQVKYGFRDTYMIDFNVGYTGSENFKPGDQFGVFPAVAAGWVPSNYNFVKDHLPWLNLLKIRGSYGTVGNDKVSGARFPYLTLIDSNSAVGWGASGSGIAERQIGADNLAWEKATKMNLGFDIEMLNKNLTLSLDFFNDKRDGIYQQRTQVPDFVGAVTMPYGNVGKMKSWGSDGNIAYTHVFNKDMSFTVRANYTYSTNEVENWEQAAQRYPYQAFAGLPYNAQRGYLSLGLFRDELDVASSPKQFGTVRPGDIKYKDVNGDGKINSDDEVPLSYSNYPRWMYGFGGEFRYKNWTLNIMFKGTGKTDYYKVGAGYNEGFYPFVNSQIGNVLTTVRDQKNRWTPASYSGDPATENPNAMFPRLSYGSNENNTKLSDFWKGNMQYLRLSELSLSYNLKAGKALRTIGVSSMDIQLIGYNLAAWSPVKMFDPEQANKNGAAYPIPRRYALQLYINF